MAELTVRFDLSFGSRSLRCLMAAGMIFSVATEVASESVTLTTYYPAPSGVYAQMITTGNTFLSRDGGYLLVGAVLAAPPASTFNVNGGAAIGTGAFISNVGPANGMIVQGSVGIGTQNPGTAGLAVMNGSVGVGTANPQSALDVANGAIAVGIIPGNPAASRVGSIYFDSTASGGLGQFLGKYPGGWQTVGGGGATNVQSFNVAWPNQSNFTVAMPGTWKFCALTLEQSVNWVQGYCMITGGGSNWFLSADRATCAASCF
jgi:hypothetical protein